jgi:DNA-binding transcriptional LysR family regulator
MGDIQLAIEDVQDLASAPRGLLRLAVSSIAERFLSGDLLATFMSRYPEVRLEITVTDEEFDITTQGYDAGVRLGEVIEQDMIAVPVSGNQRQLVVAAPSFIETYGSPLHPRELSSFRCIGWRPHPGGAPYRWEFAQEGRAFDVEVSPEFTTNDMWLMVRMACAGAGLTFGMEETFTPYLQTGMLVTVLEPFCPRIPGFFLYYPSRRNLAPKLRALLEHVRSTSKSDISTVSTLGVDLSA